jgi:hypothetical protein
VVSGAFNNKSVHFVGVIIVWFIYPIYNHNWKNISTIYTYIYTYIYITRLASNEICSPSNKIHREVGRAKDLSAPLYLSDGRI